LADELHHRVAGKSVRALDEDDPRPIAEEPLQHRLKARAVVDRFRAACGHIVVGSDDLVIRSLGVGLDGGLLALQVVLIRLNIRRRGGPQIGNGLPQPITHFTPWAMLRSIDADRTPTMSVQFRDVKLSHSTIRLQ
jgi:hypothetical protein